MLSAGDAHELHRHAHLSKRVFHCKRLLERDRVIGIPMQQQNRRGR